jgi:hypothetical protein
VISQLDHRYTAEVEDITSPSERDPYTMLRTELVRRLSLSKEQCIRQVCTLEKMNDRKPSWFLRHLSSLVLGNFLHTIWPSHLPPNMLAILTSQPESGLNAATHYAGCTPAGTQVLRNSLRATLFGSMSTISPVKWKHSALRRTTFVPAPGLPPPPSSRNHHSGSKSPSRDDTTSTLCWYHRHYGVQQKN